MKNFGTKIVLAFTAIVLTVLPVLVSYPAPAQTTIKGGVTVIGGNGSGAGVTTINGANGAVTLVPGPLGLITINTNTVAKTITIDSLGASLANNTFTGTQTAPGFIDTGITVPGNCLTTNSAGLIITTGSPCGSGGAGVTSLNTLVGALNLIAGTNMSIVPGVGTLTFNASGGSGGSGNVLFGGPGNIPEYASVFATAFSITSNVVTVTGANNFSSGQQVQPVNFTTGTYLNGQTLTVLTANSSQFTAAFTHADVSSTADTSTILTNVVGPSQNLFQINARNSLAQINSLIQSLTVSATNNPPTQLGTIVVPDGVPQTGWTNTPSQSGAGNPGVPIADIRIGVQTTPLSTWGVKCDARNVGSYVLTNGSNQVSPTANAFLQTDVGSTLAVVGSVAGVPTRFLPTILSVNATTGVATISTNAPFAGTYSALIGTLNTPKLQDAMTALGVQGLVGAVPAGCKLLSDTIIWNAGQSMVGQAPLDSMLYFLPGSDGFQNTDATGIGGVTKDGLRFGHLAIGINSNINNALPWNSVSSSGSTTNETPWYRPLGTNGPGANFPMGPGWMVGIGGLAAVNGSASVTSGSAIICVPTSYFSRLTAAAGNQIVFPNLPVVYKGTVTALSGVGCSGGFSGATVSPAMTSGSGYTVAQAGWVQGSSVQSLAGSFASGAVTYPKTVALANSIAPQPGFESNFATHGRMKVGSEEYDYLVPVIGSPSVTFIDGPSTSVGWSAGQAVVPENPCYVNYETPWPVTPTVNSGDSTPSGAVPFPSWCGGNAAISMPQANGNTYHGTGFSGALIQDLAVLDIGPAYENNTQCYYVAGNNASFATTYDKMSCEFTQFGITQGPAAAGEHGVSSAQATGFGNIYQGLTLRNTNNLVMDNIQGSVILVKDAYTTEINPVDGSKIGPGTAFDYSSALDEQNGNTVSSVGYINAPNQNSEPEITGSPTFAEVGPYFHSDANFSQFTTSNLEGAWSIFGGSYQKLDGGQASLPLVNYGSHNQFLNMIDQNIGLPGNTWGASYLEWGQFTQMAGYSSGGVGPVMNGGIGDRVPCSGGDSSTFRTGNTQGSGFNPYGSDCAGYIAPEEMGQTNAGGFLDSHPMSVGKTLDATELYAGAYSACNMSTSALCNIASFGSFNSGIYITPTTASRLQPINYDLALNLETPAGAATFQVYVYAANQSGSCGTVGAVTNKLITTTTSWVTYHIPVNFTNYSGCNLSLQYGPTSVGSAQVRVGAIQFTAIPGQVLGPVKTWTSGAACPVNGAIMGSDATNVYWCEAGAIVVQAFSSAGITAGVGDATFSGTGTVNVTVGNINGGTAFKSQPAGPECNNGSAGQLNVCLSLSTAGPVLSGIYTVPSTSTPVFDISQGNTQILTLSANATSSVTGGLSNRSEELNFEVFQPGSGGPYAFAWPTNFYGFPPVIQAAGQYTSARGFWDGTNVVADGYQSAFCDSGTNPAICGAAYKGVVAIPAGTNSTLVVNTTSVGAFSIILFNGDESAAISGVTCGTSDPSGPLKTAARNAGVSFTVQAPGTITAPYCLNYTIVNP